MTLIPRGQIDISERARGLDEHIGEPLARGAAHLRGPPVRRRPGSSSAGPAPRRPAWPPPCWPRAPSPATSSPVTIEGTEYVDGGVHSVTNADVLRSEGLDLVVIISSMSAAHGSANGADGWLRRTVHRRMEREIARLEEAGTAVISLEPGAESRRVMGLRAMAEDRGPRVIEAAYEETRERILAHARSSPRWASPLAAASAG